MFIRIGENIEEVTLPCMSETECPEMHTRRLLYKLSDPEQYYCLKCNKFYAVDVIETAAVTKALLGG